MHSCPVLCVLACLLALVYAGKRPCCVVDSDNPGVDIVVRAAAAGQLCLGLGACGRGFDLGWLCYRVRVMGAVLVGVRWVLRQYGKRTTAAHKRLVACSAAPARNRP